MMFKRVQTLISTILVGLVFLTSTQAGAACLVAPADQIGWWAGDEQTLDLVGINDGIIVGGVGYVCGEVAQAFSLDATLGTSVIIADNAALRFVGSFTISAWVRTSAIGVQDILRKRHRDSGGNMDVAIGQSSSNKFRLVAVDDTGSTNYLAGFEGTTAINDGEFHHVVGVRDDENDVLRVYVDGVKEAEGAENTGTFIEVNSATWTIGNTGSPTNLFPWNGDIDEVSIYERALSDQEISDLFDAGAGGKCKPYIFRDGFETGGLCWTESG